MPKLDDSNKKLYFYAVLMGFIVMIFWGINVINNRLDAQIKEAESQKEQLLKEIKSLKEIQEEQLEMQRKINERLNIISALSKDFDAKYSKYEYYDPELTRMVATKLYDNLGLQLAKKGMLIMEKESHFNALAVNDANNDGSNDKGCWQINTIHNIPDEKRLDCEWSTDWTIRKVKAEGDFYAWSTNALIAMEIKK